MSFSQVPVDYNLLIYLFLKHMNMFLQKEKKEISAEYIIWRLEMYYDLDNIKCTPDLMEY
ncbi:hypothetical protein KUTeg_020426 [Tegillarca granosa]|uniref:Uncharacterized protein n=1 Tax=Tegillarca granosa TaxID=220873 RepID=A0ABQ9EAF9_TEGGR|nr:hypothetical protein KUTeg_020426 [Tegillarca granosa]